MSHFLLSFDTAVYLLLVCYGLCLFETIALLHVRHTNAMFN